MGVAAAKASFAVLYLRVFPENKLSILNKCIVVFVFCQAIEEVLIVIFKCSPVSKSWYPELDGSCLSLVPLWWCTVSKFLPLMSQCSFFGCHYCSL